ncbi:hypothetical protein [Ramlibacter rhizophilus]|uniref:Uncharacterized protein n=1 Tax=Ramlibacter rhizophilus TaxID=1781167 RepID=A0A4Z0BH26_9BURK|nr:hypothetical protein [Ramlibacter rhizophilus]TFY98100.1 hypothetical protein EZ242_16775 [Ramlibacter rhizophilus]
MPEPLGVSKTDDAPDAVHRASEASDRARGVGVDASKASFVRKLLHWAHLPVALVDLLAACLAAVASFGFAAPLVPIAARQLQKVWRNEPPAAATTSPRLPTPDLDRASPPVRAAVEALRSARTRFEEASQKTRIDFHRAGFLSRLLGVGAATASLGLAIAATVASGGLAAPALVVSVLLLRQAVAHAHCAWRNWQAAEAGQPTLPMGSNAVANAAYAHARALGRPDAQARLEAARVAAGASFVVTAGCIALGAAFAVAVPLVERCVRLGCAMLQRAILPTVDNQRAQAHKIDLAQLRTQANLQLQRSLLDLLRARDEARLFLSAAHAEAEPDDLSALAAELGRWDLTDPMLQPLRQLLEDRLWLGLPARDRDTRVEALRERADVLSDATWGMGALVGGTSLLLQALT